MQESLYILLPPLFIISSYTEMKERRIPNWLTICCTICALTGNFAIGGIDGLQTSLLGMAIGAGVFLPFCLAGALGGGDFKLMGAVGSIIGYPLILWGLYYTVLCGGVLALVYAIWTGQLLKSLANLSKILLGKKREESKGLKKSITLPYGIAIASGTIWAVIQNNL